MQQQRRRSGIIIGLLALGLLAGAALTARPAQAVDAVGPYYAEPAWDQKMVVVNRFVVLTNWASQAVLDKETGLAWERSPGTIALTWNLARVKCTDSTTGNRKGWRLPSVHELASLTQPSGFTPGGPALPPGHPFLNVSLVEYWSATTFPDNSPNVWGVNINNGNVNDYSRTSAPLHAWCVRGGGPLSEY
jgi:hypothetical protein